jgi:hypothetical protein
MPHEHHADARKSQGDKLEKMAGHRGEYPCDRAARIAGVVAGGGQGDSVRPEPETFVAAPARQVSNYGNKKGA